MQHIKTRNMEHNFTYWKNMAELEIKILSILQTRKIRTNNQSPNRRESKGRVEMIVSEDINRRVAKFELINSRFMMLESGKVATVQTKQPGSIRQCVGLLFRQS